MALTNLQSGRDTALTRDNYNGNFKLPTYFHSWELFISYLKLSGFILSCFDDATVRKFGGNHQPLKLFLVTYSYFCYSCKYRVIHKLFFVFTNWWKIHNIYDNFNGDLKFKSGNQCTESSSEICINEEIRYLKQNLRRQIIKLQCINH